MTIDGLLWESICSFGFLAAFVPKSSCAAATDVRRGETCRGLKNQ